MKKLCYVNEKISLRKKTHQTFQKILSREHHTRHYTWQQKVTKKSPLCERKHLKPFKKFQVENTIQGYFKEQNEYLALLNEAE